MKPAEKERGATTMSFPVPTTRKVSSSWLAKETAAMLVAASLSVRSICWRTDLVVMGSMMWMQEAQ